MRALKQILVVLDRSEHAYNVLEKAAILATANNARVHVVRVIHESLVDYGKLSAEDAQSLKLCIMQAEKEYLVDQLGKFADRFPEVDSATIWNKRVSAGALHIAKDLGVDLVIKGANLGAPQFPRHPDDWNLVRDAQCPVLLVGSEAWANKPFITAAIDVLDVAHEEINGTILEAADMLARDLAGVLDVVSVYPRLEPWAIDTIAGLDFDRLRHNFEEEIQTRARALVSDLSCPIESIRTSHGPPGEAIRRLASQSNSDVIVIGTVARTGVSGWVIGNTSETLLDRVDRDLLTLRV